MPAKAEIGGHAFADPGLLAQALTHRSANALHNERFEFLGDALVGLLIADALFQRWPKAPEGELTRARAELVRESSLAALARTLELGNRIQLGPGEMKSGGHRRDSILADALEAVLGATFLDGGFDAARALVQGLFGEVIQTTDVASWSKDAKTELQEWLQARRLPVPTYRISATRGQAHAQTFEVECVVPALNLTESGEGRSRRVAEQEAARRMLDALKASDRPGSPLQS